MSHLPTVICMLLMIGVQAALAEQPPQPPITISVRPSLDIPLPSSNELFTIGGGMNVAATYAMPFFRYLSVGIDLGYHFAPLKVTELSVPGSLSVASGSLLADFRLVFLKRMEACVFLSGGYFYAFLNDEPSETGHNFYAAGGFGIAYRFSPRISLGIQTRFTEFMGLYRSEAAIVCLDVRGGR